MTRRPIALTGPEIEQTFRDALQLLRSVRRTLAELLDRVEAEQDPRLLKDIGLKQSELESALKRAFEAEDRYNAWHERNSGLRNACEIDFAALREEMACRLQRLHDCGDESAAAARPSTCGGEG
ncbi:hypothetical protein [Rubellimicrobium aerolatum]|uniref:DUF1127 domain-containing protein n=1 Tax=Rubellimicrobium aerolatum TaxID=490979 RepID=A0ABW0SBM0_9RHOB|nr:hypothetical protein [Rubellimicrobium aerolatum]MBP1805518.1 uncharacterized protein YjiS (DUF1127 family) [Rubellimicrobium aerolatum]